MPKKRRFILLIVVAIYFLRASFSLGIESGKAGAFAGLDLRLKGGNIISYQLRTGEHGLVFPEGLEMSIGGNKFSSDKAVVWLESRLSDFHGRAYIDYEARVYLTGNVSFQKSKSGLTVTLTQKELEEGQSLAVWFDVSGEVFITADNREIKDVRRLELYQKADSIFASIRPTFVIQREAMVPEWIEKKKEIEPVKITKKVEKKKEAEKRVEPAKPSFIEKAVVQEKTKEQEKPKEKEPQFIYPVLSDEKLNKLKNEYSVDTSYRLGSLQFRINVFLENDGICAAIRALSLNIPKVEKVGFPNNVWEDIIKKKQGLVLVTGITGAGKSTTIASLIDKISEKSACRIITIEDPIEYIYRQKHSVVSQREVGRDVKSFVDGLRSMMREDPDIIFVGEMRDPETIAMTLMAAETGHLVFSTLHTRDVAGTITRILDYFPEGRQNEVRNQLSLGLAYIVSQKLIPRKDGNGRVIAMEIMNNNYACANLIRIGKTEQIYSQLQTKTQDKTDEKMLTLESHLARLVKADIVDLLEAQMWANDIKCFIDAMKREQSKPGYEHRI